MPTLTSTPPARPPLATVAESAPVPPAGIPAASVPPDVTLYPLSVEQFDGMVRQGILTEDEPVELLDGLLVLKMTKNPPHVLSGKLTAIELGRLCPATCHVATQGAFTTAASRPEPDVAIVRGSPRDYADRFPTPADMALVVEVADSSVARDRGIKRRVYARAGVPVYWIVVLPERAVEVYTGPSGPTADEPAYAAVRRFADGDRVPVVVDGVAVGTVAVADLLP